MLQKISTRQHQILKLLLENKSGLSIDDIANALNISRTAVQHHFLAIENDGYIMKNTLNKTAGRPVAFYVITDKGINYFPKQYSWFSEIVLEDLQQEISSERFKSYMRRLGVGVAEKLKSRVDGKNLNEQVDDLTAIMEELGYQAKRSSVTENDTLDIQAHNCVYHNLAKKYHDICEFDLALMSNLLDREVELLTCMAKGDCACRFKINEFENTPSQ